jgi:hypothetical protein
MSRQDSTDLLDVMRRFDPVDRAALREELGDGGIARAMAVAIDAGEAETSSPKRRDRDRPRRAASNRGRSLTRTPVLAAGLVLVIAAVLLVTGAFSGGGRPSYATAAIEVAEANPRLLITAPGWKVTGAGERFEAEEGEMTFGDGSRELTLDWYPERLYRGILRDRSHVSPPRRSRLLGRTATTVDYGRREYATILAPIGRVFVELRGRLGDRAAYWSVLRSLRPVDVETWLAAMPRGVVVPDTHASVVHDMLRGLPRPPGFDAAALEGETTVADHYQLGVRVASAVACGWVESWLAARRAGDAEAERTAVAAMAGSRHWPLLLRMAREVPGAWTRNVWLAAAELRAGRLGQGSAGEIVRPDGSGYKLEPAWAVMLECRSRIRKVPFDGH